MDVEQTLDDFGKPFFTVQTDKAVEPYYIRKSNDGFIFYEIRTKSGKIAADLAGKYSSSVAALEALEKYVANKRITKEAKRNANSKARIEDKNAQRVQSDSKKQVQQGTAD